METYKSYAQLISKDFGIDLEKVLEMKVSDIEQLSKDRFEEIVKKRLEDPVRIKRFQVLCPDYDKFYEAFGQTLLECYCRYKQDSVFEWNSVASKNFEYTEENKGIFWEEKDGGSYRYPTYSKTRYLAARGFYQFAPIIVDAMAIKMPQFIKYAPSIYGYSDEGMASLITFTIIKKKMVNSEAKTDDEDEDDDDNEEKTFTCSLQAFLGMDWDAMLEDHLNHVGFLKVRSKEEAKYKEVNDFMNTPEIREFKELIESTPSFITLCDA